MKKVILTVTLLALFGALNFTVSAQEGAAPRTGATPNPNLADILAQNLQNQTSDVSRERREQAYTKLLEGQRYLWSRQRARSQSSVRAAIQQARQAVEEAVELDPRLAEGYTVLAELSLLAPPFDAEQAIKLANIGTGLNKNNFGAHRILARLYTLKSGIGKNDGSLGSPAQSNSLNTEFTTKAIDQWKEITRLDSRNPEAWAFLAAFYEELGKKQNRIEALNNWVSSSTPLETSFYRNVFGPQENLSTENAALKLAGALIEGNQPKEAIEILSRAIADDPENSAAVELLREALESADTNSALIAVEALKQAVYANPENVALIKLLAIFRRVPGSLTNRQKHSATAFQNLPKKIKMPPPICKSRSATITPTTSVMTKRSPFIKTHCKFAVSIIS